jgi:hypothetical protein
VGCLIQPREIKIEIKKYEQISKLPKFPEILVPTTVFNMDVRLR